MVLLKLEITPYYYSAENGQVTVAIVEMDNGEVSVKPLICQECN